MHSGRNSLISRKSLASSCRLKAFTVLNFNTLWTGDADLRLHINTVQDG